MIKSIGFSAEKTSVDDYIKRLSRKENPHLWKNFWHFSDELRKTFECLGRNE